MQKEDKNSIKAQKLNEYLNQWESKAAEIKSIILNKDIIKNKLEYEYDKLIGEYDRKVEFKTESKKKYPIVYIDSVYNLEVNYKSYIAYVIFAVSEKGFFRALDIKIAEKTREYFNKEYWYNIFNDLKENKIKGTNIFFVDNIEAIRETTKEVFPNVDVQLNVLSLVRKMASKISDNNKGEFTSDLLSIYTLAKKSQADELTSRISELWKIKCVQEWKDNWDDISRIFKYSDKVRKCIFENIVFKDFNKSLYNTKISNFEDLEKSIREIVEDAISKNYLSSLFDWENVLKEIKEENKFK